MITLGISSNKYSVGKYAIVITTRSICCRALYFQTYWLIDFSVIIKVGTPATLATALACNIHEDSASRVNSAKPVALSTEKRGPLRAEGDRVRCDALFALASNRQSVISGSTINLLKTL